MTGFQPLSEEPSTILSIGLMLCLEPSCLAALVPLAFISSTMTAFICNLHSGRFTWVVICLCDLGHTARVLHMAMSPDGSTVVSAAADETLRLWKCFAVDPQKKVKQSSSKKDSNSSLIFHSLR